MENLRKYGNPPFWVAVIHGGPGVPGEMILCQLFDMMNRCPEN